MSMLEIKLGPQDKIKIGITILLLIILIFAAANAINAGKKQKILKAQPSAAAVSPVADNNYAALFSEDSLYRKLENDSDKLQLERDPFTRIQAANIEKEISSIRLSGIIWDTKNPKAILNGKILGVGAKINEHLIVEIRPDRVIFSDGERQREISIKKD